MTKAEKLQQVYNNHPECVEKITLLEAQLVVDARLKTHAGNKQTSCYIRSIKGIRLNLDLKHYD